MRKENSLKKGPIEYTTFVKRNIASYLTASLFDTAVKITRAWAQGPATPEKGDSQHVAKWPIIEYQSLVLISFFRLSIKDIHLQILSRRKFKYSVFHIFWPGMKWYFYQVVPIIFKIKTRRVWEYGMFIFNCLLNLPPLSLTLASNLQGMK